MRVVTYREQSDCGIVALSMYLGASYEDVLRVVTVSDRHQGKQGLWSRTMIRIAARLGHRLRRKASVDWENDYGVLRLPDHAAVLRNGLVIDGDGTLWEADAYIANRKVMADECEIFVCEE